MSRRPVIVFFVLLVAVILGVVGFVRSERAEAWFCAAVERELGKMVDGQATVGSCRVGLRSAELVFGDVGLDSPGSGLTIRLESATLRFSAVRGFDDLSVELFELVRPVVVMDLSVLPKSDDPLLPGSTCRLPGSIARLSRLAIVEGSLALVLGSGSVLRLTDVSIGGVRRGGHLMLSMSSGEGWFADSRLEEPIEALRAEVGLEPKKSSIRSMSFSGSSEDLAVSFRGSVEDLCEPVVSGTLLADGGLKRLAHLLAVTPYLEPVSGRMRLTAKVEAGGEGFSALVHAQITEGSTGPVALGDMEIQAHVKRDGLTIEKLSTDVFGGKLDVSGSISFDELLTTRLEVSGRDQSIARLVTALGLPGSWVDARFSPRAVLEGTLHPLLLEGRASLPLDDFVLLERYTSLGAPAPDEALLAFSGVAIDGALAIDADEIRISGARAVRGDSSFTATGKFPLSGDAEMDLTLDLHLLDLASLGNVVKMSYGGQARGMVSLRGPYGSPRIVADVDASLLSVLGIKAGDASGRVRYDELILSLEGFSGRLGRTRYTADRFVIDLGGRPEPLLDLRFSFNDAMLEEVLDAFIDFGPEVVGELVGITGRARGGAMVRGSLDKLDVDFNATAVDGLLFDQPYQRARGLGRLRSMERFEIDELSFGFAEEDSIVIRGLATIGGPLALSLSAREVPSQSLFFGEELPLFGLVSGDLVIEGTWDHPEGKGVGLMIESTLSKSPVPPARLALRLDGMRLHASGHMVEDQMIGSVWVDLEEPHEFHLDVEFHEPDLRTWIMEGETGSSRWFPRVAARGRARLGGLAPDPTTIEGLVVIESLQATWDSVEEPSKTSLGPGRGADSRPLEVVAMAPVEIGLAKGGMALGRLRMSGSGAELEASGLLSADGGLDMAVRAAFNLDALERVFPEVVSHAGGHLGLEVSVGGTTQSPTLVGSGRLRSGELRVEGAPIGLSALDGVLSFSQSRVIVDELTGSMASGTLSAGGEIFLERFRPREIRLFANIEDVRLRIPEDLQTTVSGRLLLTGAPSELVLGGEAEVTRGRWIGELEMDQLLPSFGRRVASAEPDSDRSPLVSLDVRLLAPGTIRVDNRTAKGRLAADLRVVGTDARPSVLGTVSVAEGIARFRGNEYEVTRGIVELRDPERIDPWFDVAAESEIREYRVALHAYGTLADPRVVLSSDPPLPETDLVTLMTLGITAQDTDALGDALAAAAAADALFVMSGLDRHVRGFIPENPIIRDPSVRLTSGYSVRTGQVSPRLAFESTILMDSLRLRYSAPIGQPGQKTQAEYRITEVVSAQAEWDTEGRRTTSLGNLGLDLKLRWEMD